MDIVACTDKRFVMVTGVMLQSVCVNNTDTTITFHLIVDKSVDDSRIADLKGVVQPYKNKLIVVYRVDEQNYSNMPKVQNHPTITNATYYRLDIASILPNDIEKVLYLDGDIICRKSLMALWETDIANYAVAAVPDYDEEVIRKLDYLHLSTWNGYFNAGVLLINLKYWRDHHLSGIFYEVIDKEGNILRNGDQDVLNYVLNEKKLSLPLKYNLASGWLMVREGYDKQKYAEELQDARRDPVMVHYTSSKPWYAYHRYPHPFRSTFFKYRDQTIWKNEPLWDPRPLKKRITKRIATFLRRWKLLPELPPNGMEYVDIDPID